MDSTPNRRVRVAGLCIVALFGILLAFITPPMQVPDEQRHFFRAYQISEGTFFPRVQGEFAGGELPVALREMEGMFSHLFRRELRKTSAADLLSALEIRYGHEREFLEFNNTALFPFPSYIVPATGIAAARIFSDRVYLGFISARLLNLLLGLMLLWLSIRIYPRAEPVFFAIALLPMNMFEMASISSDVFTNYAALLFSAIAFRQMEIGHLDRRSVVSLLLAGTLLASSKQIAVPLLGMVVLIPLVSWRNLVRELPKLALFYALVIPVFIFWSVMAKKSYMPLPWHPGSHAMLQVDHIIMYPMAHFEVLVNDIYHRWPRYVAMTVGSNLGYLETRLPTWLVHGYLVMLGVLAIGTHRIPMKIIQGAGLIALFVLGVFTIELALYINTSPIGAVFNDHIHGRYFIPYLPALFIGIIVLLKYRVDPRISRFALPGVLIFGAASMIITLHTVIYRYYVATPAA